MLKWIFDKITGNTAPEDFVNRRFHYVVLPPMPHDEPWTPERVRQETQELIRLGRSTYRDGIAPGRTTPNRASDSNAETRQQTREERAAAIFARMSDPVPATPLTHKRKREWEEPSQEQTEAEQRINLHYTPNYAPLPAQQQRTGRRLSR